MLEHLAILAIGFLAQVFFSARIIVQWIMSERAHRVLSPSAFWVFSIAGSYLLFIYGWLRSDFAIILGQFVSYFIYLFFSCNSIIMNCINHFMLFSYLLIKC